MKTVLAAFQKCPSAAEFEQYIKKSGDTNFKTTFENHVKECSFCAEALEGYNKAGIINVTSFSSKSTQAFKKQHRQQNFQITQWSIAATIALLVGISTFYFYSKNNQTYFNFSSHSDEFIVAESPQVTGQKKLTKNLNEQYWYLGQNNVIAVNDLIIAPETIEQIIKNSKPIEAIIIEIKNTDFAYSNQIINTLKSIQKAPVFTL